MPPNKQLALNFKKPIVAVDGQNLSITEQGPVNLIFFQLRGETEEAIMADVVAAVRFHTLEELRNLQRLINDTIKQYENRKR